LRVQNPATSQSNDPWAQWQVGQVVTFRFLCSLSSSQNCNVTFESFYSAVTESPGVHLQVTRGQGRAITLQVEKWATDTGTYRFFELYRSPVGVPNP